MAYSFNGTTQYLSAAVADVNSYPLTMFCWVDVGATSDDRGYMFGLYDATTSWHRVSMANLYFGTAYFQVHGDVGAAQNTTVSYGTGWQAFTYVLEASSQKAYVSGATASTAVDVGVITAVDNTIIGARYNATPVIANYCPDPIAECAIWSAALTVAEIAALEAGISPRLIRPGSLKFYRSLVRDLNAPFIGTTLTNNNAATVSNHPQVIYPAPGYQSFVVSSATPPTITDPGDFQCAVAVAKAIPTTITITDGTTPALRLQCTSGKGTMDLADLVSGVAVAAGARGTNDVTFSGTKAQVILAALDIEYTGVAQGTDTAVVITVDDTVSTAVVETITVQSGKMLITNATESGMNTTLATVTMTHGTAEVVALTMLSTDTTTEATDSDSSNITVSAPVGGAGVGWFLRRRRRS